MPRFNKVKLEVLATQDGRAQGGVLHADLKQASLAALAVPRHEARARSLEFSWTHAARLFEGHLVAARHSVGSQRVAGDALTGQGL